jgi:ribosomal protein S18 acetylase RimI-like enzyme
MKVAAVTRALRSGDVITLRSPELDEAKGVLEYIRELARDAARNLNHPASFFEAMSESDERGFLESCEKHPTNFLIAAYLDNGRVIGTTGLAQSAPTFSRHTGELGLGVLAPYRKLGVGRVLMDALIEQAQANGIWNLMLRVRTFNAPAIALYESLGFRRVGVLHRVAALPDGLADEYLYQREGQREGQREAGQQPA